MPDTHQKVGELFAQVDLSSDRFVSVKDGQKMCVDHDTRYSDPEEVPGNNYGIYADADDGVVILDVDDHRDDSFNKETTVAVAALSGLPRTLKMKSPHVPEEGAGGHKIYKLAGEQTPAELFKEEFGKHNPVPSWGEVVAKNKYVVGAGSGLDSCDKDWHDCSEAGEGHYGIKVDEEIAEVEPEELVSALAADPDLTPVEDDNDGEESGAGAKQSPQNTGSKQKTTVTREYSREEVEEMLDCLPGDQHFDDWIRTGYAVYDWSDSDTGKEVFKEWSKDNRKWEKEESQRQIDYIWENGEQAGGDEDDRNASVGTLVYLAKEEGWEPPQSSQSDGIGPNNPAGDLQVDNGCYGYWDEIKVGDDKEVVWRQVTNFKLETLEFVETDDKEEIRIRVIPGHEAEEPYEVTVEPTVFNEARSFKEEIVVGRTTQYETQHSDTLNELRLTVGAQDAPVRKGVSHLGAATEELEELVTPDGVLTADGWADDPEHKYYAKASSDSGDESIVGERWRLSPDENIEIDEEEVREALKLLPESRLPDRALATMGWFYSAPAKPLIHGLEGEFNHLHIRGKTESGKTSYLQVLSEAFGMSGSPFPATSTGFSLEQLHVGSRGAPVWIDEYKPSQMGSRKTDKLHMYLRLATRESVYTKGRQNQTFMKFRMQSPIVLSGEQKVGEPAVRRRMLQVNLSERATADSDHVRAYSKLAGEPYEGENGRTQAPAGVDLQNHALAYYKFLLSEDAEVLRDVWTASRKTTAKILDEIDMTLQDTEFQGAQTVVFGYRLYKRFAQEMGVPENELPGEKALRHAIKHLGENVGANGQRREHGDEFLELVSQAANAGFIKPPHETEDVSAGYRVYDPSVTTDEALALHLPTVYPEVKRYAREYNVEDDYNLLNKSDYDDEFSDLADSAGNHVVKTSHAAKIGGSTKRCVLLEPHKTSERLGYDFDLSAFGIYEEEEEENANDGESDNDGDGGEQPDHPEPVQIGEVDPSKQDIASVSASIEFGEYDGRNTDESTPAWTATLSDDTGEAQLVVWDEEDIPKMYDATGVFEPDALDVRGVEVSEYEGELQLVVGESTTIYEAPEAGQGQLDATDSKAAADGGEFVPPKPKVIEYIQNRCDSGDVLSKAEVAGKMEIAPDKAESVLEKIKKEKRLLQDHSDGWEVL